MGTVLLARRDFLVRTGLILGAGALAGVPGCSFGDEDEPGESKAAAAASPGLADWSAVRAQFELVGDQRHFAAFLLSSHPAAVREAIESHRRGLDENTAVYLHENEIRLEMETLRSAAAYLGVSSEDIALTDSTTMGLALLYGGLRIREGEEILTTEHDFYSTHESLRLRAERTGASIRRIGLYEDPVSASEEGIVDSIARALTPRTRVLAVTWVHSSTGVKLPIRAIADALAAVNASRDEASRVLLCVDAVHALGVEDVELPDLGCDFLVSGCHKWLFGPRGTGLVWGRPEAWQGVVATIPTFSDPESFTAWVEGRPPSATAPGAVMTPGGFHAFEHRWALGKAFDFHRGIGRDRVAARTRELASALKEGLAGMAHVRLRTPLAEELSAGLVCLEVDGLDPDDAVERLRAERIVASVTPYAQRYVRLGPSIVTSPEDVDEVLRAIRALA